MGGLLSGGFGLVLDVVNTADPGLTTPSGLYVYLWICGVEIKDDLILQFCVQFLYPGVKLVGHVKAMSLKVV